MCFTLHPQPIGGDQFVDQKLKPAHCARHLIPAGRRLPTDGRIITFHPNRIRTNIKKKGRTASAAIFIVGHWWQPDALLVPQEGEL